MIENEEAKLTVKARRLAGQVVDHLQTSVPKIFGFELRQAYPDIDELQANIRHQFLQVFLELEKIERVHKFCREANSGEVETEWREEISEIIEFLDALSSPEIDIERDVRIAINTFSEAHDFLLLNGKLSEIITYLRRKLEQGEEYFLFKIIELIRTDLGEKYEKKKPKPEIDFSVVFHNFQTAFGRFLAEILREKLNS